MLSAYVDPIDGFSISTYDQSSEISSSPNKSNNKSSRFGDLASNGRRLSAFQPFSRHGNSNRRISMPNKCQIFTSDLDMYERSYSSETDSASSFISPDSVSFCKALEYGIRQSRQHMNSDYFQADTETSSGVISTDISDSITTGTTSSDSSMFSYPHQNWTSVKDIHVKSNFFRGVLDTPAITLNRNATEANPNSYDKVLGWFRQNPENAAGKRASLGPIPVPSNPVKYHPAANVRTTKSFQIRQPPLISGREATTITANYYNSSEGSYVI